MPSNATKALIADVNRLAREQRAEAKAAYEAAVARIDEHAASLITEYLAADDPEQARADFLAVNGPDAEPVRESRRYEATSVLPTGERMNPRSPESAVYFDADQTAYIVRSLDAEKPSRVITSFGSPLGWNVGSVQSLRHDQTWASLGQVEVVGVIEYASGFSAGEVPNRSLAHSVFK